MDGPFNPGANNPAAVPFNPGGGHPIRAPPYSKQDGFSSEDNPFNPGVDSSDAAHLHPPSNATSKVRSGTDGAVTETDAGGDIKTATRDGAMVPTNIIASDVNLINGKPSANAYSGDKASSSKLEALHAQSQALSSIAQALILQIQALNKQVDCLL